MEAKKLFEILKGDQLVSMHGTLDKDVSDITIDSRAVSEGSCFIAVKGLKSDGHTYIDNAVKSGASYIVCEVLPNHLIPDITYIQVRDSRKCIALLAQVFYDYPSKKLSVIGVTGTNGKTTIATLLFQLFTKLGYKCGLISTVENKIGDLVLPSTHTTPDAISIASLMADMYEQGCTHIFMEVSSHALDQYRTFGIDFKVAIFSNITHDHLDYHKTFINYINAKKLFFDWLSKDAVSIINIDDKNGKVMVQNTKSKVITYALHQMANYHVKLLSDDITGLHLKINNHEVMFSMTGAFNAYNIAAVLAASVAIGEDETKTLEVLSTLTGAEGRMEKVIDKVNGKIGIVDYAHTPDALENVLKTIKASLKEGQKVITVVGCGGDRDASKRPVMASIAAKMSDIAIFTSDNPRTEDPEKILDNMFEGLDDNMRSKSLRIADRLMAIKTAVMVASRGDVILIAGKGHEKYQEINGIKYPFEDKKVLSEFFSGNT